MGLDTTPPVHRAAAPPMHRSTPLLLCTYATSAPGGCNSARILGGAARRRKPPENSEELHWIPTKRSSCRRRSRTSGYLNEVHCFIRRVRCCLLHRRRCSGSGDIAHTTPVHVILRGGMMGRDNYGESAKNNTGTQDHEFENECYQTKIHLVIAHQRKSKPEGGEKEEWDYFPRRNSSKR